MVIKDRFSRTWRRHISSPSRPIFTAVRATRLGNVCFVFMLFVFLFFATTPPRIVCCSTDWGPNPSDVSSCTLTDTEKISLVSGIFLKPFFIYRGPRNSVMLCYYIHESLLFCLLSVLCVGI